jgi:hypothetical protein
MRGTRPHRNVWRRNEIRKEIGLEEEGPGRYGWAHHAMYLNPFTSWQRDRKPGRALYDRVFCAFLITEDIDLSIGIGNRCKTRDEAVQQAKAMALLKGTAQ